MTDHAALAESLVVEGEPPRRDRIRYPGDLMRVVLAIVGLALLITLGQVLGGTFAGFEADIGDATKVVPLSVLNLVATLAGVVALAFPFVTVVLLAMRRSTLALVQAVVAGVLAAAGYAVYQAFVLAYA